MDEQKKPRAREKRVVGEGKGVEKHGEGLGTGPVGNAGEYKERKEQEAARQQQAPRTGSPLGGFNPFGSQQSSGQQRPQQTNPFAQQRPQAQERPQAFNPFGSKPSNQDSATDGGKQYNSAVKMNSSGGGQRASGFGFGTGSGGSGGSGKFMMIIIALVVMVLGGKFTGLFDGGTGSQTTSSSSGGGGLSNLLSSFMGSTGNSVYDTGDLGSLLSGLTGGGSSQSTGISSGNSIEEYFTSSGGENSSTLDESVSSKARDKYTTIRGNNRDTVTIMVYMCGADLESQQGMATSDLKEMANATLSDKVNLIIYTGGAKKWRNNVVSSSVNQIYQIKDGAFYCLEKDMGTGSMTSPETLAKFLDYGKENFPADRMCLIFWDHGGGSVSGYGYDEHYGHNQTMTLSGINKALKSAGIKFDFIGFDTCLMATVENGMMLSQYADYMIASEETEPGVGWYYTRWLTELSKKTSMPTIEIGKNIADDFVSVCNQKCRGQATTLSVVDLAELQATVPKELTKFSVNTNELIQNKEYKKVSTARSKSREFAQHSRIDQIDLIHFAQNMGTKEGTSLAKALKGAIKYNRTGGNISNAYGLSIYFPYKRTNKVNQIVSTYKDIGMDEEYTRCIQEFASLEISGQVSAGTPISSYGSSQGMTYPGLMNSLTGSGGYTSNYSAGGLSDLLGELYGGGGSGGSTGSILDLFMGRSMTADKAAEYILENHFDASDLVWQNGRITLSKDQWGMVESVKRNVFFDDGKGYIDLGCDTDVDIQGDALLSSFDGTWISIDRQPVAYYYLDTVEDGDHYVISGYVPAILNGERVKLILNFDDENPYGYIAGAQKVYDGSEDDPQGKGLIAIGEGDRIQFICDYYDYNENYQDSYKLGDMITLGSEVEIANTRIDDGTGKCKVTYCFTDYYQQRYWTPTAP